MATKKKIAYDGLIGFYLHTYKDKKLEYQGLVIAMDGDTALVQLYSWLDGGPTNVIPLHKTVIYSDYCKLYATMEDMHVSYQKQIEK